VSKIKVERKLLIGKNSFFRKNNEKRTRRLLKGILLIPRIVFFCHGNTEKKQGNFFIIQNSIFFGLVSCQESILPNFDFFFFAIKLGHFKVQTIFSHATNAQG
jgi:hypothetical protein